MLYDSACICLVVSLDALSKRKHRFARPVIHSVVGLPPELNQIRPSTPAQHEPEAVQKDGFAGPGFAGDNIVSRAESQLGLINEDVVLDAEIQRIQAAVAADDFSEVAQLATLETQLALKARESAAEREEDAKYAEEVRSAAAEAKEAEARLEAERRERAVANRLDLERQIAEKTRRRVADHDDVMDEQERLFNAAILDQATRVVVGGEDF